MLEDVVVEDKIDVVVLLFGVDVLLAGDEGESFSEFHQKSLKVGDDGSFKGVFAELAAGLQTKEFRDDRVLDEF